MAAKALITRRAAIVGGAAAVAAITPVYGARAHTSAKDRFRAAFAELKAAAMEMDPTIKGAWAGWNDDEMNGRFLLTSIIFDRSGKALDAAAKMRAEANT